jgi:hypothetical protein
LKAALLALKYFGARLRGHSVLLRTDNMTTFVV